MTSKERAIALWSLSLLVAVVVARANVIGTLADWILGRRAEPMRVAVNMSGGEAWIRSLDGYAYRGCAVTTADGGQYGPFDIRTSDTKLWGVVGSPAAVECHLRGDRFGDWHQGRFRWP